MGESAHGAQTLLQGPAPSIGPPGRPRPVERLVRSFIMLHYAVVFFVIALIAAVLGFSGIAAGAAGIAKI